MACSGSEASQSWMEPRPEPCPQSRVSPTDAEVLTKVSDPNSRHCSHISVALLKRFVMNIFKNMQQRQKNKMKTQALITQVQQF